MGWLRTLFRTSTAPEDLPLSARVAQLEGDLLHVRAQSDAMHGSLRKLQGKIYRGVSLGETVEKEVPDAAAGVEQHVGDVFEKAALYRRAAEIRGR